MPESPVCVYEGAWAMQLHTQEDITYLRVSHQDGCAMDVPLATWLLMLGYVLREVGLTHETGTPRWPWAEKDQATWPS